VVGRDACSCGDSFELGQQIGGVGRDGITKAGVLDERIDLRRAAHRVDHALEDLVNRFAKVFTLGQTSGATITGNNKGLGHVGQRTPSVVEVAALSLRATALLLFDQASFDRAAARSGGSALGRRWCECIGENPCEALCCRSPVLVLRALLGRGGAEHSVDKVGREPIEKSCALPVAEARGVGDVEENFGPTIGGVHRLSTRP